MIHAYKNNGYNIVLDVNSGSVHVVDDVVFDLVEVVEDRLCSKYGTAAAADDNSGVDEKEIEMLFEDVRSTTDICSKYSLEDIREAIEELLELRASQVLPAEALRRSRRRF